MLVFIRRDRVLTECCRGNGVRHPPRIQIARENSKAQRSKACERETTRSYKEAHRVKDRQSECEECEER